jgi:hypothetical protein
MFHGRDRMALDLKKRALKELSTVDISIRLHEFLATYFDILKVRIMEAAARRANARRCGEERELITPTDIVQAAQELLPESAAELEGLLIDEKIHGTHRKRAS